MKLSRDECARECPPVRIGIPFSRDRSRERTRRATERARIDEYPLPFLPFSRFFDRMHPLDSAARRRNVTAGKESGENDENSCRETVRPLPRRRTSPYSRRFVYNGFVYSYGIPQADSSNRYGAGPVYLRSDTGVRQYNGSSDGVGGEQWIPRCGIVLFTSFSLVLVTWAAWPRGLTQRPFKTFEIAKTVCRGARGNPTCVATITPVPTRVHDGVGREGEGLYSFARIHVSRMETWTGWVHSARYRERAENEPFARQTRAGSLFRLLRGYARLTTPELYSPAPARAKLIFAAHQFRVDSARLYGADSV